MTKTAALINFISFPSRRSQTGEREKYQKTTVSQLEKNKGGSIKSDAKNRLLLLQIIIKDHYYR